MARERQREIRTGKENDRANERQGESNDRARDRQSERKTE